MIFHSKGGYDFYTIYNMPVWLRKFTFSEIDKYYKEEDAATKAAQSKTKGAKNMVDSDGKINTPSFAEASKAYKGKTSYK
jgi:hypothetical protein